jgi:hypothetical protein
MGTDELAALLAGWRDLIAARDDLAARTNWDDPASVSEFNAAQDKLAARVPLLLDAVEAVLKLADEAEPWGWKPGERGIRIPVRWDLDPAKVREAITAALTGKEASDGQ